MALCGSMVVNLQQIWSVGFDRPHEIFCGSYGKLPENLVSLVV